MDPNLKLYLFSPYFTQSDEEDTSVRAVFLEYYKTLAIPLQDFLIDSKTADILLEIGSKYGLASPQIEVLAHILRDVAVGDLFIRSFPVQISAKLKMSLEESARLGNEIVANIPPEALTEVKKIQREKFAATINSLEAQRNTPQSLPAREAVRPNIPANRPIRPVAIPSQQTAKGNIINLRTRQ